MLARENRITAVADFRRVQRKGHRSYGDAITVSVAKVEGATRFGFIAGKDVGNSVTRKGVSRRLREAARLVLADYGVGFEVVVRATAPATELSVADFEAIIRKAITR